MGIIPKEGDKKEPVGLIPLVIVHYLLGLGIAFIGQRTKNRIEFFGGIAFFVVAVGYVTVLLSQGFSSESLEFEVPYFFLSIASWAYIAGRLIWIAVKQVTEIKLL